MPLSPIPPLPHFEVWVYAPDITHYTGNRYTVYYIYRCSFPVISLASLGTRIDTFLILGLVIQRNVWFASAKFFTFIRCAPMNWLKEHSSVVSCCIGSMQPHDENVLPKQESMAINHVLVILSYLDHILLVHSFSLSACH